jgi:ribosome-binding protein aMBF1 (putative translation factor)
MTPAQCRAARAFLDISQEDLAKAANVGLSTVRNYEKGRSVPIENNLSAMEAVLVARGIQFVSKGDNETCGVLYAEPIKATAH